LTSLAVVFAAMTLTAFAAPKSIKVATDATWPPMEILQATEL
jgi:ABC-type amino acid transport substrate-binding protein